MNYNLILSRLLNTVKQRPNMPNVCFEIFTKKKSISETCDCVDYCKYGPPPDLIWKLNKFENDKKYIIQNWI